MQKKIFGKVSNKKTIKVILCGVSRDRWTLAKPLATNPPLRKIFPPRLTKQPRNLGVKACVNPGTGCHQKVTSWPEMTPTAGFPASALVGSVLTNPRSRSIDSDNE